jgi:head-tail adaptor
MRAGKMRHKAEVFKPDGTIGADGSISQTLTSIGTFACAVYNYTRDEKDKAAGITSLVKYKLVFRHSAVLSDVTPDSEIVVDGALRLYVVSSMNRHLKDRTLEVVCEERR